jgi:hypothetical protein
MTIPDPIKFALLLRQAQMVGERVPAVEAGGGGSSK